MIGGERTLYQVNNISMAQGIIRFVKVRALGLRKVDTNAHINVGTTNINGRGDFSAKTTPAGGYHQDVQVGRALLTRDATTNHALWSGS